MRKSFIALILVLISVSLCVADSMPMPTKSKYFTTKGGGFVIKRQLKSFHYSISYIINKPFSTDIPIIVEFENPNDIENPLTFEGIIKANQSELHVQSELINSITNNKNYKVVLKAYKDNSYIELICEQIDHVRFQIPQSMVDALDLNVK